MTATTHANPTETTANALVDFEVTNECQCLHCNSCEMSFQSSYFDTECPDCGNDGEHLGDCFGCYEYMHDPVIEAATAWFAANPSDAGLYTIAGENLTWRRLSGYKIIDSSDDVIDAISVNATWRQTWTINPTAGGQFTATMSHHDVPTGSSFTIRPALPNEID